jgi:predicted phage terminase large subunit-like protein
MIDPTPAERDAIFRSDPLAFAKAAFHLLEPTGVFEPSWHHDAIVQLLIESSSKKTRKFINAPPRSLKSFLVSVAWVAFTLGHDPSHRFLCASYSRDLASNLAAQCRRLMQSELYQRLFATRLLKIAEDELTTTEGGSRICTSVGSTLTGFGADTIIVDDPLSADGAYSETSRKNANNRLNSTVMSRLNDKRRGSIFVVCQRLHQDDITGGLIQRKWGGLVLPAIAQRDTIIQIGAWSYSWKEGEPLQARESLEVLEDQREQMMPAAFAAQYLQDPLPEAGAMLQRDWLKWYDSRPVRQPGDQIVQSWDTAVKVKATADYSVCLTFLVRNKNEYYLIDIWRKKVAFHELCLEVANQAARHRPNAILIEDQSSGSPLIDECKRLSMTGIIRRRSSAPKDARMYGETAKLQAGCLVLPKAAPWLEEFLMEYLAFPGSKHDDQIDGLSQFLNWRTEAEDSFPLVWDVSCPDVNDDGNDDGGGMLGAPSPDEFLWQIRR